MIVVGLCVAVADGEGGVVDGEAEVDGVTDGETLELGETDGLTLVEGVGLTELEGEPDGVGDALEDGVIDGLLDALGLGLTLTEGDGDGLLLTDARGLGLQAVCAGFPFPMPVCWSHSYPLLGSVPFGAWPGGFLLSALPTVPLMGALPFPCCPVLGVGQYAPQVVLAEAWAGNVPRAVASGNASTLPRTKPRNGLLTCMRCPP